MLNRTALLQRIINTPLLATQEKAEVVVSVLLRRAGVEVTIEAGEDVMAPARSAGPLQEARMVSRHGDHPYLFDPESGIAVIEVIGSLAHRQGHLGMSSGVMGYDGIQAQLDSAVMNPTVRGIMLDMHSFGGEVSGAFQLADRIGEVSEMKPTITIVDDVSLSAAYLLASQTDEVWLSGETAEVGSVGVVMVHMSFEAMLKEDGVEVTIIKSGDQKADGNPFESISAETLARFQATVDSVAGQFYGRVAQGRGLKEKAVKDMEAGRYMGQSAVTAGLADGVANPIEVFGAFADELNQERRATV